MRFFMTTSSIEQLIEIKDELRKSLPNIKVSEFGDSKYGPENEYTAKGVIAGLDALITDLASLTKAPTKFIQASNHNERTQLVQIFRKSLTDVNNKNLASIAESIDQIKPLMRVYGVRQNGDRKEEFVSHIDELQRKALEFTENLGTFSETINSLDNIKSQIDAYHGNLKERLSQLESEEGRLQKLIEEIEEKNEKINSLLDKFAKQSVEIESLLTDSRSHEEIIDSFSKKVIQREDQLKEQEHRTEKFNEALAQYKYIQEKYLEEASELIESAKIALEYKTAEGLSAAFTEKYNESKNDGSTKGWIIASALFLIAAIGIGIWTVSEKDLEIEAIVARVSLIPMLIAGAWFGASQYIKQKNLAEDYAYKSVLTKSMVGFSEQLSGDKRKGEEYTHYIKSVLNEIHNDPLRRHGIKNIYDKVEEKKSKDPQKDTVSLQELLYKFKDELKDLLDQHRKT